MPKYRQALSLEQQHWFGSTFLHGTHQHFPPRTLKKSAYSHIWEKIDKIGLYRTKLVPRNTFMASDTNALAKLYNRRACGIVRVHVLPAGVLFIRITRNERRAA